MRKKSRGIYDVRERIALKSTQSVGVSRRKRGQVRREILNFLGCDMEFPPKSQMTGSGESIQ